MGKCFTCLTPHRFCGSAKWRWVVLRDTLYSDKNDTWADIENDIAFLRLTRENALAMLIYYSCPFCAEMGRFQLFEEHNIDGAGLRCAACNHEHLFGQYWLKFSRGTRRPTDVAGVMHHCGWYCYICGVPAEELQAIGVKMEVHHTKRFADDGAETGQKIPVCAVCHPVVTSMQRKVRRMLK